MAVVFMVQQLGPIRGQHQVLLRQLVYQAIWSDELDRAPSERGKPLRSLCRR